MISCAHGHVAWARENIGNFKLDIPWLRPPPTNTANPMRGHSAAPNSGGLALLVGQTEQVRKCSERSNRIVQSGPTELAKIVADFQSEVQLRYRFMLSESLTGNVDLEFYWSPQRNLTCLALKCSRPTWQCRIILPSRQRATRR